jgi:hypothetical protein
MKIDVKQVSYYNFFGNGDLHYSREFVKFFCQKLPFFSTYTHIRCPHLLRDLPVIFLNKLPTSQRDPNSIGLYFEDPVLMFGTWIGQSKGIWLNQDGCTISNNYKMYKRFASVFELELLEEIEYIPTIDYSKYNINGISIKKDKNILVCNGPCISGQARNFDIDNIIFTLAKKHPSCTFYVTQPVQSDINNIVDVNSLIEDKTKSNLNEISYISTFCDIIVGRGSGPFCFTHVKQNLFDSNKTYIGFGNTEREINWVTMTDYNVPSYAKQLWNNTDYGCEDKVFNMIDEEINAKFGNR